MGLKEYWFPRYPGRWKADTMHLDPYEDGVYSRLVDHYMETKTPLPDNNVALARIAGAPVDKFEEIAGTIREFFKADGAGRLHHKKCDAILKEQSKMSKSYATRGRLGGKAKANKTANHSEEKTGTESNSQAIAKQKNKPNLAHNTTRHDTTGKEYIDEHSNQLKESNLSTPARGSGSFSIEKFLRDEDRASVRKAAPGWDIYFLFREFDERVNGGAFERPNKPFPAFLAWVKGFTKGKAP